jgi:hypothetical protein
MNLFKNFLLLGLAALAIGASYVAWSQHREMLEWRAKSVDPAAHAALQKRLAAAQGNVQELERQLQELRQPSASVAVPAGVASARRVAAGGSFSELLPVLAAFLDRPEMQRMMASQQKLGVERQYARLFKSLDLSPEQKEQFEALLLDKQLAGLDAMIASADRLMYEAKRGGGNRMCKNST